MKQLKIITGILIMGIMLGMALSCASSRQINADKSGAQLWGENCIRCHNTPSPDTFSDAQWDVAISHMRVRATLTQQETDKIIDFLKSAN